MPEKPSAPSRFVTSFNENYGIPASVSQNPFEALQGVKLAVSHPSLEWESLAEMYRNMTLGQQALIDHAYQLQHMNGIESKAKGFALGVYSALPVVGPAIVSSLDKIAAGDWAGGVGGLFATGTQLFGGAAAKRLGGQAPEPTATPPPMSFEEAKQKQLRPRQVSWEEENPQLGDVRQRTKNSSVETLREFDVNDPRLVHEMDLPKRLGPEYGEHYDKALAEKYSKLPAETALPIELTDTGKELLISDGWHRWEAAKLRGDKTIKAWVNYAK